MSRPIGDDGGGEESKGRGRGRGGSFVFKVLCPDALVSSIIGKGGDTRKAIEEASGARLKISGREEFYPETHCRVLVATAGEAKSIMLALEQIMTKVVEVGNVEVEQRDRGGGKGRRVEESDSMLGKEPGEYTFRAALPAPSTGALIGSRGAKIKALRERTGAKVFVDNEIFEGHQMVRLIGTSQAIVLALPSVCEAIDEEMNEERLQQWASVLVFQEGGRKGKGAGKRPPAWEERGKGEDSGGKGSRRGGGEERRARSRSRNAHPRWELQEQPWVPEPFSAFRGPPTEGHATAHLEAMHAMSLEFPPGALGMAHAVTCDLPNYRVGGLIGRKGEYINYVQRETGAQVAFSEAPRSSEVSHRTMTITGPLLAVYAAHMLMMKRFHEEEEPPMRGGHGGGNEGRIGQLQSQLADLERQLAEARGGEAPGAWRKGKGKR